MTRIVSLGFVAVLVLGCKGTKEDAPAPPAAPPPVAAAPGDAAPAPVVDAAPPLDPAVAKAIEADQKQQAQIAALAADPAKAAEIAGPKGALYMVWDNKGKVQTKSASCTAAVRFGALVAPLAKDAVGNVGCQDNRCIHYKTDEYRIAFIFRDDHTLEGVLENVETSDAAGTDDDVAELQEALARVCKPK
jgi:hypothetical protein